MCINCQNTSATVSGLLTITSLPQEAPEGKGEHKKKASPIAEMLKENARAISVREIKTHYAGLACLGLLLNCQLTARAG